MYNCMENVSIYCSGFSQKKRVDSLVQIKDKDKEQQVLTRTIDDRGEYMAVPGQEYKNSPKRANFFFTRT